MYVESNYEEPELTTKKEENQKVFGDYQQYSDNSSEWGFLNIDEWGSSLIEIDEKNIIYSDIGGEYVLIDSYANIFDFNLPQNLNMQQLMNGSLEMNNRVSFQVIDNDSFTMSFDGITIINIVDRIRENSSTVFEMECEGTKMYMIPLKCLNISDFSEIFKLPIVNVDGENFYKAYIN